MRQYETGFVVAPNLSEEETEKFIGQMAEVVSLKNGKMIKLDVWGKRRLAFPIKRFQEGVYVFFVYEGDGDIAQELERRFKQTDSVIRYLTVKKDLRDQTRRKKKGAAAEQPAPAAEPPAEAVSGVKEEEK
ncbi:MAG: 30S ribosomal protein S6 [Acidobacteriota bacterium]|nr:30S ribosomal protein S6 [Acidobacteriota bacterium]